MTDKVVGSSVSAWKNKTHRVQYVMPIVICRYEWPSDHRKHAKYAFMVIEMNDEKKTDYTKELATIGDRLNRNAHFAHSKFGIS